MLLARNGFEPCFHEKFTFIPLRLCGKYNTINTISFQIGMSQADFPPLNIRMGRTGEEVKSMKYVCEVCGYVYDETAGDPDNGIAPGTKWEDLPEDFVCPLCGVGKEDFSKED